MPAVSIDFRSFGPAADSTLEPASTETASVRVEWR